MALHVGKHLRERLRSRQSAYKALVDLEQMVAQGRSIPRTRLKRSGHGRLGTFQGYLDLDLWHAKLDPSGQNKGDPVLVLQRTADGELHAVALTDHQTYLTSDAGQCRRWLWEHRDDLDWVSSAQAPALLEDLAREFDAGAFPRPK